MGVSRSFIKPLVVRTDLLVSTINIRQEALQNVIIMLSVVFCNVRVL